MKIVIANGNKEADFIISTYNKKQDLIVINSDKSICEQIAFKYRIACINADPWKEYVLDDAGVRNADVFIALSDSDTDNYVSCLTAKRVFGVKKCICTVSNPNNVEIFKQLGIDSVISSTYLLAESIRNESSIESLVKTLSLEGDRIVLAEIVVPQNAKIVGKMIMEIGFPRTASIACIYRNPQVIIPNGSTIVRAKDKLVVACIPQEQDMIFNFVTEKDI